MGAAGALRGRAERIWGMTRLRCLGLYLRHAPEHPGRWRLVRRAARLAPILKASSRRRVIRVAGLGRMAIDGSSQTGRILFATGSYEPGCSLVMRQHLHPGACMIDVGANIGYFTLAAARRVGPSGRVVAFEPQESVRRELVENVRLNGLTNVSIREEALSASSGSAEFYPGRRDNTGLASLRPLEGVTPTRVVQARFDDLWDDRAITLVKIDVEGAELQVLEGMSRCLERHRPSLVIEVTDGYLRALGASAEALYTWVQSRGYRLFQIEEDGRLTRLESPSAVGRSTQFNAFCSVG